MIQPTTNKAEIRELLILHEIIPFFPILIHIKYTKEGFCHIKRDPQVERKGPAALAPIIGRILCLSNKTISLVSHLNRTSKISTKKSTHDRLIEEGRFPFFKTTITTIWLSQDQEPQHSTKFKWSIEENSIKKILVAILTTGLMVNETAFCQASPKVETSGSTFTRGGEKIWTMKVSSLANVGTAAGSTSCRCSEVRSSLASEDHMEFVVASSNRPNISQKKNRCRPSRGCKALSWSIFRFLQQWLPIKVDEGSVCGWWNGSGWREADRWLCDEKATTNTG